MTPLRIATYNIHKCRGMDGKVSPGRIAEVIAEVKPDIIGLQEVHSFEEGSRDRHQAQYLADELGMHLAIGEVRKLQGGIYGNAVLSRYPLQAICHYDLSCPGREQRGCVRTDVCVQDGDPLHVFNLHLGTAFQERRYQARRMIETELVRARDLIGPRVVLGDFNEWTRGLVSQTLSAEFRSADIRLHLKRMRTYPGIFPMLHLDHIYYDEDLKVERVILHRTPKALLASDHLPLYADFLLRKPESNGAE